MTPSTIARAAELLSAARLARRRFERLPEDCRPPDLAAAYAVQDALHARLTAAGCGAVAGHKIGCTTPVMQRFLAIDDPCAGGVFAPTVHHGRGSVSSCRLSACRRRVRDRGPPRARPARSRRTVPSRPRRRGDRRLHGRDRGGRRPLRGLPVARYPDAGRRRLLQCRLRAGRAGRGLARARPRGHPRSHDDQRRRGRRGQRRRHPRPSARGARLARQCARERAAGSSRPGRSSCSAAWSRPDGSTPAIWSRSRSKGSAGRAPDSPKPSGRVRLARARARTWRPRPRRSGLCRSRQSSTLPLAKRRRPAISHPSWLRPVRDPPKGDNAMRRSRWLSVVWLGLRWRWA